MNIRITRADARNAGDDYTESRTCLLATALKRIFDVSYISVSPTCASVGLHTYSITRTGNTKLMRAMKNAKHKTRAFRPFGIQIHQTNSRVW